MRNLFRLAALSLGLAVWLPATPHTIADITGDGVSHAIATSGSALWIQFVAGAGNSGTARVGQCGVVATTAGIPLAAGAGMFLPVKGNPLQVNQYALAQWCYLVTSNDKLTITYEDQF